MGVNARRLNLVIVIGVVGLLFAALSVWRQVQQYRGEWLITTANAVMATGQEIDHRLQERRRKVEALRLLTEEALKYGPRVEQPSAVTGLERAIAAGGGGDRGKAHVVDKVAYTWFNRIIALRFMDANGYTGIGVVSPAAEQVGQPEVLAAAKRGQVDGDVVKAANAATVKGLLNGTRQPRPGDIKPIGGGIHRRR